MDRGHLPEGWEVKKLNDVCFKIQDGSHVSPQTLYDKGGDNRFLYITSKNIRNGYIDLAKIFYVDSDFHNSIYPRCNPELGDVLLTKDGVNTGNVTVNTLNEPFSLLSSVCLVKTNPDKLIAAFLVYYIQSKTGFDQIIGKMTGAAIKRIILKTIKSSIIPVPPVDEQKRIVVILDEAFEGIDQAIRNTEKNFANARELFESYLNKIFTQKGDGWEEKTLGDVCIFQGGSQPSKAVFSPEKKEGYIRLIQIRDYKSDKHIVYIPKKDARRFCQPDDVMIGRYGPPLFQILRGLEGAYNVALMKAIPNELLVSKDFLFYFLKNGKILNYIIHSSNRAAGQIGLNKATIEPYPIAFPSLETQVKIVSDLRILYSETKRLENIYRQKLAALNELKQSILQKAFTGQLTSKNC